MNNAEKKNNFGEKSKVSVLIDQGSKHPLFRFILRFGIFAGLTYVMVIVTDFYNSPVYHMYFRLLLKLSKFILDTLGQELLVKNGVVVVPGYSAVIVDGCSAFAQIYVFACALLAFPASLMKKILGLVLGPVCIVITNAFRVVSLVFIGMHGQDELFLFVHDDFGPAMIMAVTLLFWVIWVRLAKSSSGRESLATD